MAFCLFIKTKLAMINEGEGKTKWIKENAVGFSQNFTNTTYSWYTVACKNIQSLCSKISKLYSLYPYKNVKFEVYLAFDINKDNAS